MNLYRVYNRIILFFYHLCKRKIKLTDDEILMFFNSLYEYFRVRNDLVLALESIVEMNYKFKIFNCVINDLKKGDSFSISVEKLNLFDDTVISLIKSGDYNNSLLDCLEMVKDYMRVKINRMNDIKNALIYPVFVTFIFSLVIIMFSYYVIPSLIDVFMEVNDNFIKEVQYLLYFVFFLKILVGLGFIILLSCFLLHKFSKEKFYKILFYFSSIRQIMVEYYIVLVTGSMYNSFKNNLDLNKSLEISANSISIEFIKKYILNIKNDVAQGRFINEVLSKNKYIPKLFISILKLGEDIGDLSKSAKLANDVFKEQFDKKVKSFFGYLPIFLIGLISIFLIMFVYLLFIPIYNLGV